jgi:RimJ/RimL family protein N-acetyltransferase
VPNETLPDRLRTERLVLARWRSEHAEALRVALDTNVDHLRGWIPWRIAEPAPLAEIEARIARHSMEFDARLEWVYGIFSPDEREVFGAIGVYPRDTDGRVALGSADRVELGYWLRSDVTGRGYASEAARAVMDAAVAHTGLTLVEIRCDARNAASAAIPARLGFALTETIERTSDNGRTALMIWTKVVEGEAP